MHRGEGGSAATPIAIELVTAETRKQLMQKVACLLLVKRSERLLCHERRGDRKKEEEAHAGGKYGRDAALKTTSG